MVTEDAFSTLTDDQIALLRAEGEIRRTSTGEVLFREGDRGYDFIVILAGQITIVDHQAGVERELVSGGPGAFVAELNLLTGERLFTTAVVTESGSVLAVPLARLQALVSRDQALGELIVGTMYGRRQWLVERQTGLRIVGSLSSPHTRGLLGSRSATDSRMSGSTPTAIRPPTPSWTVTRRRATRRPSWSCAAARC